MSKKEALIRITSDLRMPQSQQVLDYIKSITGTYLLEDD